MEGINLAEELKNLANEIKDKWINIRCTEQERQDIMELANKHSMHVSKFIFWLIDKQRKEDEGNV